MSEPRNIELIGEMLPVIEDNQMRAMIQKVPPIYREDFLRIAFEETDFNIVKTVVNDWQRDHGDG